MTNTAEDDSRTWHTSVHDLMESFRDSLLALIPPLERARIPWRKPEAYDDWDAVAQALFTNIVIRSVEWSLPGFPEGTLSVPNYGLSYSDYSGMSFVEVVRDTAGPSQLLLFVRFDTVDSPFDNVVCYHVTQAGQRLSEVAEKIPAVECRFRFQLREAANGLRQLDRLSVLLYPTPS